MAYQEYTTCAEPSTINNSLGIISGVIGTLLVIGTGITLFLTGILIVNFAAASIFAVISFCTGVIAYTNWWLHHRLACLGGDRCALGMLMEVEPPEEKSGLNSYDTDYSINILLAPSIEGDAQSDIENGFQGELIKKQSVITDNGLDYLPRTRDGQTFTGEFTKSNEKGIFTSVLHAEFEGGGVNNLDTLAKIALAIALVAAAVVFIPVVGPIAAAFFTILALIFLLLGFKGSNRPDMYGKPSDVNPNLGVFHTNEGDSADTLTGAEILVVSGRWVFDHRAYWFDKVHPGWNEIHPIRSCHKIGKWLGNRKWSYSGKLDPEPGWEGNATELPWDEATMRDLRDRWCYNIGRVQMPSTVANQQQPEHRWTIHPVVDGCRSSEDTNNDTYTPPEIK